MYKRNIHGNKYSELELALLEAFNGRENPRLRKAIIRIVNNNAALRRKNEQTALIEYNNELLIKDRNALIRELKYLVHFAILSATKNKDTKLFKQITKVQKLLEGRDYNE